MRQDKIGDTDERGENQHGHEDHGRGAHDLLTAGPGDLLHFRAHFRNELLYRVPHTDVPIAVSQARRDSNPQRAVLETAALPIGATGLIAHSSINIKTEKNTPPRIVS